jgi:predicted nicotinamide N-methyase
MAGHFFLQLCRMRFPLVTKSVVLGKEEVVVYAPDEDAVKQACQAGQISFPYWSQVWPAAKALAEFILLHPAYTTKKTVVELGAGLGLPSLVAARYATSVFCTDHSPEAVITVAQSAQQLELQNFSSAVLDWNHLPANLEADVLLLSDVNYEPAAFATLQQLIRRYLEKGTTVLLSTPQRLIGKEFLLSLAPFICRHEQPGILHLGQSVPVSVLVLKK